jgi:hypothetical protein
MSASFSSSSLTFNSVFRFGSIQASQVRSANSHFWLAVAILLFSWIVLTGIKTSL